jgi:hypothetical protein
VTLPALDYQVVAAEGPKYKVGPRCANPMCTRFAEHAHHIVRRSALGGPRDWIKVDGCVVGNVAGLCASCHENVTGRIGGHRAAIRWETQTRSFWWCLLGEERGQVSYILGAELDPHPPRPGAVALEEPELCPTCGQRKRHAASSAGRGPRRRKTWLVRVPDDEEENGADVLDSLVEAIVPVVPNSDVTAAGRYYVLVPSLAYVLMDLPRFETTMAGVGG